LVYIDDVLLLSAKDKKSVMFYSTSLMLHGGYCKFALKERVLQVFRMAYIVRTVL